MLERLIARIARALSRHTGLHLARVVVREAKSNRSQTAEREVLCVSVGATELLRWCADPVLELAEQHVRSAFERGDICVAAYIGDRMIGYEWISTGPTPHVAGLWVEIDPAACYFYKKFVHPNFRGLRIGDALSANAEEAAIRLGRNQVLGFIELHNMSSWRSSKRRGSCTAGYVGYLSWFGRSIPFRTRGAAQIGFRFFSSPVPAHAPLPWSS